MENNIYTRYKVLHQIMIMYGSKARAEDSYIGDRGQVGSVWMFQS